jgi:hypothetical protein
MKTVTLFVLIISSICVSAASPQWDYSHVDRLSNQAWALIEGRQPTAGYALYEEILYLIRIEKGLYSTDQVPYLLEYMEWRRAVGDWGKVLDTGNRILWLLGRNENQLDNYRRLVMMHIHVPDDISCLERHTDTGSFIKSASRCEALRYFIADSFISATEIQQKVLLLTGLPADREALKTLAQTTAKLVYWVDGPPILLEIRGNEFSRTDNPEIRRRYRPETWSRVANEAGGE